MAENISFGECLSSLLQALNLKPSKLAREINIDSSLVYKWLRNERVPSYETQYIDQIVGYIMKKISNTYQKEELINFLMKFDNELIVINNTHIADQIKKVLCEAQGCSIRIHRTIKRSTKKAPVFKENGVNICNIQNDNKYVESIKPPEKLFRDKDWIRVIKGRKEVTYSEIELLKQAYIKPSSNDNNILITFGSGIDILMNDDELRTSWINTVCTLMNYGWNIIFQILLDNNVKKTMKMIEAFQALLGHGKIKIYFNKINSDTNSWSEQYIVPGIGALFCFPSTNEHLIDRAFWFHSRESISFLTEHFSVCLKASKPLLKSFPPQKVTEFLQAFTDAEETLGDRYVFKYGLSMTTMPLDLYEKYTGSIEKNERETSYRVFLYKRRLEAFETQVKYYKYKDICFSESIEELLNEWQYSSCEDNLPEDRVIGDADIESHLTNLINMLEHYKNYELAVISRKQFGHLADINWTVKDGYCVLLEVNSSAPPTNSNNRPDLNFIINEKSVVDAFRDYYQLIWDKIPDNNKNKAEVIKWLNALKKRYRSRKNSLQLLVPITNGN